MRDWQEEMIYSRRELPGRGDSAEPRPHRFSPPALRVRLRRRRIGIAAFNDELLRRSTGLERILGAGGAQIFGPGVFYGPLNVQNADPDYRNLRIGANVSLGAGCLLDLAAALDIEEDVTISMGCTILTHVSVGDRPLKNRIPSHRDETRIARGAYLGANVTILGGCDIGAEAIVGAGAVVTRPVPAGVTVVGVPAKPV